MYALLSLLGIFGIIQVIISEPPVTPTCCLPGLTLVRSKFNSYACINGTEIENLPIDSFVYSNALPVYGYRIQQPKTHDHNASKPLCYQQQLVAFSGTTDAKITPRSCLISIDEQIMALSCSLENNERVELLSFVHKCCPIDHIYDARQRKCLLSNPNFEYYSSLLRNAAAFIEQPMDCPKDKVLVEYRLSADEFAFNNGQLVLHDVIRKRFNFNRYCLEAIEESAYIKDNPTNTRASFVNSSIPVEFLVRTCDDLAVCQQLPCIRRCCSDGETFTRGNATSYCKKDTTDVAFHSVESLEMSANFTKPAVFGILRSLDCLKYPLAPDEAHTISEQNGSILVQETQEMFTNAEYCLEKTKNSFGGNPKMFTFLCFNSKDVRNDRIRFKMYPIGILISCSFYAITLLVYLSISRLRNLPGKILICLVSSLFTAYLAIAVGQLAPVPNDRICFLSGFFVYFCLMAAFAWMNVMCFDIWQTFGSTNKKQSIKNRQTTRFVCYSLYGWGLPTLLTVTTVSLTRSGVLPDNLRPQFGHGKCWFTYDTFASANLLFFSGPVGVLFLMNFVLFSLTLRYCNKVKREIFRMQSSNMEKPALRRRFFMDKARFVMNTKLFVVMGITWLLELLSILLYDHKQTFFWAVSDSFNVLLGVFVFFIFVFKKRIWYSILERFGLRSGNPKNGPNETFATHSTCAPSMSMTRLNAIDGNSSLLSTKGSPNQRAFPK